MVMGDQRRLRRGKSRGGRRLGLATLRLLLRLLVPLTEALKLSLEQMDGLQFLLGNLK
jgi:hypothetical protein